MPGSIGVSVSLRLLWHPYARSPSFSEADDISMARRSTDSAIGRRWSCAAFFCFPPLPVRSSRFSLIAAGSAFL